MFRYQDQAAGFAIEPGDDGNLTATGHFEDEVFLQSVQQRGRVPRLVGMNHQVRRFIDKGKVVIVLDDLEFRVVESQVDFGRIV